MGDVSDARTILQGFIDALNDRELDRLDQWVAVDYIQHQPGVPQGLAGVKAFFAASLAAWSDEHGWIEHLVVEGDQIAALMGFEGTHTGEFLGIAATGKRVRIVTADFFRIADGKLAEHRAVWDPTEYLRQMDALPPMLSL
jgi:predicted ester cyclase